MTQNNDAQHQKAGSRKVYEIHGSALRNYCMSCGKRYPEDYIFESKEPIPHCTCGGVIRPDITLNEEMLPDEAVEYAREALAIDERCSLAAIVLGAMRRGLYPVWLRCCGRTDLIEL